jgi:hypothetical protein
MALASSNGNYLYGKGRVYFKTSGGTAYIDLGNVPKFELAIELTKAEHYSSRSGIKEKDLELITQKKATTTFSLEEFSAENINLAFLGDSLQTSSQAAGYVANTSTALVDDQYVDLGKHNVYVTKITHGSVTGTAFVAGETITGGTSSAAGKVGWKTSTYVELYDVVAADNFVVGETITGGTGNGTATITAVETVEDIIVGNASPIVTRYVAGTDYNVDSQAGFIRMLASGAITSPAFLTYDYEANTLQAVRAMANSTSRGELMFIGDPDQGPKMRVQCWDVSLTISGSVGLISDDVASIPMTGEILSSATLHSTEPFFRATVIS